MLMIIVIEETIRHAKVRFPMGSIFSSLFWIAFNLSLIFFL